MSNFDVSFTSGSSSSQPVDSNICNNKHIQCHQLSIQRLVEKLPTGGVLATIWALLSCLSKGNQSKAFPLQQPLYCFMIKRVLCKIWGFDGGDYEEWCLLGCYAMWLFVRTDVGGT
jgi:hypothetical protein